MDDLELAISRLKSYMLTSNLLDGVRKDLALILKTIQTQDPKLRVSTWPLPSPQIQPPFRSNKQ